MSARPAGVSLPYHPAVSGNPYQGLLYGRCAAAGIEPHPIRDVLELGDSATARPTVALHLHWTHTFLRNSGDRSEAEDRIARLKRALDRLLSDGGRIIWTVHNVLPHETSFPDLEASVCGAIAARASVVHVMCDATIEAAAPWYEIPRERTVVIPHASYLGVYPNYLSPQEARARLGLEAQHTVLTVFGGIRRYKALPALLDAFEAISARLPDLRLVIAGKPMGYAGIAALRSRREGNRAVVAHLDRVPARDVQLYLNAADALVLPHESVLNSGVVGLAHAFGRPVIAPRTGCVAQQVTAETGITFEPADRASLEQALADAGSLKAPRYRAAALKRAHAYPPDSMAADFAALVRRICAGR